MMASGGPPASVSSTPRPQPRPPRSPTRPSRNSSGSRKKPAQAKRCTARSAGEKPSAMPWRAAAKPAAQKKAAPAPHSMPTMTGDGATAANAGGHGHRFISRRANCNAADWGPLCGRNARNTGAHGPDTARAEEQRTNPRGLGRRGHGRAGARRRRALRGRLRRRHLQHRGLPGARRRRRSASRPRSATIPTRTACSRSRRPRTSGATSCCARRAACRGSTWSTTTRAGARRLYHWCDAAPARELFELDNWARVAEGLLAARLIYFTGITLSLYSNVGLGRFLAVLEMARKDGVKIAFDGNFRPRGWKGDVGRARAVFHRGAQAGRHRAAGVRRRGDPVGRPEPRVDGRPHAGVRHRRGGGEERAEQRAGRGRRQDASTCRCRKWSSRSTRWRPATASTPATWRRASPAPRRSRPPLAAHRLAGQVIRHRGAIMPRVGAAMH